MSWILGFLGKCLRVPIWVYDLFSVQQIFTIKLRNGPEPILKLLKIKVEPIYLDSSRDPGMNQGMKKILIHQGTHKRVWKKISFQKIFLWKLDSNGPTVFLGSNLKSSYIHKPMWFIYFFFYFLIFKFIFWKIENLKILLMRKLKFSWNRFGKQLVKDWILNFNYVVRD